MHQAKYNLPARKWYTLEQATKRIAKLTGEDIDVADLLHYWSVGTLNLSAYVVNYPAVIQIGDIKFFDKSLIDFHLIKDCEEDYFLEDIFSCRQSLQTTYSNDFVTGEITSYPKSDFRDYISGFMIMPCAGGIKTNAEQQEIMEKGICLNGRNYLISPAEISDRRTIILFSAMTEYDLFLPISNLVVMHYDLLRFLSGKTERINVEIEVAKFGRKQDKHLEEIIELGRNTFIKYPYATANKIAKEVRLFMMNKYNLPDHSIIKSNRILEYYKAHNIGAEGKEKNTKKPITVVTH